MNVLGRVSWVVVSAVVLAACGPAAHHQRTDEGTEAPSSSSRVTGWPGSGVASAAEPATPAARERPITVWPIGANVVWAATAVDAFTGTEHVVVTVDAGASWSDVTPPGLRTETPARRITSLFVLDALHAWISYGGIADGAPQTLISTADTGRQWTRLSRTPWPTCALDFVSPDRGWCVRDRATMGQDAFELFGTSDGGRTWQRINRAGSPPVACDKGVEFTTATLGWAVATCVAGTPPIYRTRDGGAHWIRTTTQPGPSALASGAGFRGAPVVAGDRAAIALDRGRPGGTLIYRSTDGGNTWQSLRPPGPASWWAADLRTPDSWVLVHGNQLLRTDDAGRTWQHTTMDHRLDPITGSYYDYAPALYFPTRSTGWIRTFDPPQLWRTTTAGRSWVRIAIPRT